MSGAKQRVTLTDLREPQQLRELNRQLAWIWDQLLGGLNMKSLSSGTRRIIESKVSSEELESAIRQSEDEILIEVRRPASAVDTKNGIVIDENGVEISAGGGGQYIRVTDEMIDASDIRSATVSPRYAGAKLLTVNPNATAEEMEAWGIYRSLSDALAAVNGKQLEGKIRINCADDAVMYGDAEIHGVCGGEIEINAADSTLYGRMTISGCSCTVSINRLKITAAEGAALRLGGAGQLVKLWSCEMNSRSADAVYAENGTRLYAADSKLIAPEGRAAYVTTGAFGVFVNCIGEGTLVTQFASLAAMGTVPDGGCEDWGGSLMNAEGVVPTGTDGEAAVPVIQTASYTMLHSDSYAAGANFRSWAYPDVQDDDIRQGYTEHAGRISGCMWFDNAAIRSALAGRTVNQASLRLYAMPGVGRGLAVTAELWGTGMEYAGRSGEPEKTVSYGIIGAATPGEAVSITIPVQAVYDLVDGRINGLMLYSSDTKVYGTKNYSANYARFAGSSTGTADTVPVLTVVSGGENRATSALGAAVLGAMILGR